MFKPGLLVWALLAVVDHAWSQSATSLDIRYPVRDVDLAEMSLQVDASDVERHIVTVQQHIPVSSGPLTLLYPEWIPGKHGPRGAIERVAGLTISAAGTTLPWVRDPQYVYAFQVQVPKDITVLDVEFQYLSPVNTRVGALEATNELLMLNWYAVALYPSGYALRRIPVQASLKLPTDFTLASALTSTLQNGIHVFERTTAAVLFDSPVFAGRYARRIELTPINPKSSNLKPGNPKPNAKPVFLNVFADNAAQLAITDGQIAAHRKLVSEAIALFDSAHYDHYDFLLHVSNRLASVGIEHHRSSENVTSGNYFTEWERSNARSLLPHEFSHSWNGKFRMPASQVVPHFNTPITNELMWVYEGQTQYWGEVLSARSGLRSLPQELDSLAMLAAAMQRRVGREWRPTLDTTNDPIFLQRRPQSFPSWQRNEDYYSDGLLIWLDVDTRIRELSRGQRSLNDFAKVFFGERDGSWQPMPYGLDDVVAVLNRIQPDDWAGFLTARVEPAGKPVLFDGLNRAGYKLVFTDKPTDYFKFSEESRKVVDLIYSIGVILEAGRITETQWQSPAFTAGLIAGDEIVAVNGETYTGALLKEAITRAKGGTEPIELLIKNDTRYRTIKLSYNEGLRYPRLARIDGRPALLDAILSPLTRP